METKQKQSIEGNNNTQTIYNGGTFVMGIQRDEVVNIIESYSYVKKEELVDTVLEVITNIKEENKKMPDKQTFIPLLQQLSYNIDNEYLKETYKRLLKSTMDTTKYVHPSFVSIISQLTPDEIKLLSICSPNTLFTKPIIDASIVYGPMKTSIQTVKNFSDIGIGICDSPLNICAYLENLERLKLIEIEIQELSFNQSKYEELKKHPFVVALCTVHTEGKTPSEFRYKIVYTYKSFHLTHFGVQFLEACSK